MFDGKTILVTGASGLIGYNLVKRLMQGESVSLYVTGRSIQKLENTFKEFTNATNLHLCEYGYVLTHLYEYPRFDYVFHAAGPMERDVIINRPVDVIVPNIIDLHTILEYVTQLNKIGHICRVLVFSSVTVYQNHTEKDIVVKETDANSAQSLDNPMVCYSESKRMCEVLAQSYAKQNGLNVVIARFSTVYGPTKNVPDTAFYDFVKKALAGENIMLNGVGLPRRDNIYVDDAVSGLLTIAVKGESGEAYNISSNCELSNFKAMDEIAQTMQMVAAKEFGKEIFVMIPPFEERQPGVKMDNTKLSQLGWKINTSFDNGVFLTMKSLLN